MESTKDAGDKKRKRAIKVEPGTAAGDAKADPKKLRVRTLYLQRKRNCYHFLPF